MAERAGPLAQRVGVERQPDLLARDIVVLRVAHVLAAGRVAGFGADVAGVVLRLARVGDAFADGWR